MRLNALCSCFPIPLLLFASSVALSDLSQHQEAASNACFATLATGNEWRYEIFRELIFFLCLLSFAFGFAGFGDAIDADKVAGILRMSFGFARKVYSAFLLLDCFGGVGSLSWSVGQMWCVESRTGR